MLEISVVNFTSTPNRDIWSGWNIPFFVGVGISAAERMLATMAVVILASGLTMGVTAYWFEKRRCIPLAASEGSR